MTMSLTYLRRSWHCLWVILPAVLRSCCCKWWIILCFRLTPVWPVLIIIIHMCTIPQTRKIRLDKYVRLLGRLYIHTCRYSAPSARRQWRGLTCIGNTCRWGPILCFWGAKFPKIGDSLLRTPMNRRAKFDAASFILAGEIRNRTNKQTNKNKQ